MNVGDASVTVEAPQVSLQLVQAAADSGEKTPLSDIAKSVLADAGLGASVGVGTGLAVTTLAVAIGSDVATASTVAVSAGAAIASGAGAGTALGSTLGPIGAAVGVIVGLFAGFLSTVDVSHYGDPAYGTELGRWGKSYFSSHPVNPILSIQLENDPTFQHALQAALNEFDWSGFDTSMNQVFAQSGGRATLRTDTPVGHAIALFLDSLANQGVPKKTIHNVIALYCDFVTRVQYAWLAFMYKHPGPAWNLKDEARVGVTPLWILADEYASLAFLGVTAQNAMKYRPAGSSLSWEQATPALWGFGDTQDQDPKSWPDVSGTPYYKMLEAALEGAIPSVSIDLAPQVLAKSVGSRLIEGIMVAAAVLAGYEIWKYAKRRA